MNLDDVCRGTIEDAARLIEQREVSPVELADAVLARIERLQPQLNAYITVTPERAREDAKRAEAEIASGGYRGALHGIPIAHKDLFATAGIRTTAGSKIRADIVPDDDAVVVSALAKAGTVLTGKLNLHEWAYGTSSDNPHFGPVRNPWDDERVPGGSSGGSGAAVAAGMAFAATGSDTGGSIRIPASECGCVGLMPTYDRVSLQDVVPLSWSLDHAGPLARSVRDAAIMLQAMATAPLLHAPDEDVAIPDYLADIERGAKGLRVGVPKQWFWSNIDADVERLVRAAIATLESAGAELCGVECAEAVRYSAAVGQVLLPEASAYHTQYFPARKDEYGTDVATLLDLGAKIPVVDHVKAVQAMHRARAGEADEALLRGADVLAVPTVPEQPPRIDEVRGELRNAGRTVFTSLFDFTGQPVITVPCGLTSNGLPVGLSLVGKRWGEATLLRAARAYEVARGPLPAPPSS